MDTAKYAGVPDLYAAGQKGSSKLICSREVLLGCRCINTERGTFIVLRERSFRIWRVQRTILHARRAGEIARAIRQDGE